MDSETLQLLSEMDEILNYRKKNLNIMRRDNEKYVDDAKIQFKSFNEKYPQIL